MKFVLAFLILLFCLSPKITHAASNTPPQLIFEKAHVNKINRQGFNKVHSLYQIFSATIEDGKDIGKTVTIQSGVQTTLAPNQIVKSGEEIILTQIPDATGKLEYQVYDTYRVNSLIYLFIAFVIFVLLIARLKGVGSIIGLGISLAVIFFYIVPNILSGNDPLQASIIGSMITLFFITYFAHGVSKQTTIALLSTFIALWLTAWISTMFVNIASLGGFSEQASVLQFGQAANVNLKGLLLGGIIIGTLGALNDITTTQAAAIFELAKTDEWLNWVKLFKKGYKIGREHIVSMVNTLVLAYAGSSLILILVVVLNPQKLPFWVILNGEDISDEIIRTLAGTMGLITVVPIVTFLAALFCDRKLREKFINLLYSLR